MATKGATTTITGQTALLMHAFPMQPIEAIEKKSPEEQAKLSLYLDPDGRIYVAITTGLMPLHPDGDAQP
jgi:hypothetical protein